MKKILVTGGSGFVGRSLIKRLLDRYPDVEVTSLSRSESMLAKLLAEVDSPRFSIRLADVRDAEDVKCALKDKDTVVHLAAMKRVDVCEVECEAAATINVLGTLNMLRGFRGDTFVHMSTDKSVEPCNCYGATKMVAEKMVMEYAAKSGGPRFMVVRSGNIMGSTGSVLDIWAQQVRMHNEITVTDPDMTRFYVSVDRVVDLFVAVLERGENRKIYFTPSGDPVVLKDLISDAVSRFGNAQTRVRRIGLRMGERMSERMRMPDEPNVVADFAESAPGPAPAKAGSGLPDSMENPAPIRVVPIGGPIPRFLNLMADA